MKVLLLITLMLIVTYLPRMLPSVLCDRIKFGKKFRKYLELIPYAAMAALIFPGILSVDENTVIVGIVGAAVAVLLSLIKKMPVVLVVIAAVLADMAVYLLI